MSKHRQHATNRTLHLVDLENLLGDRRKEEVALDGLCRYVALAHAPAELVIRRYSRLVVGSGDGIFVDRAIAARA